MTQDMMIFEVDGIEYHHPHNLDGRQPTVTVRPMIQLRTDYTSSYMIIFNNKPKGGLMDSDVDEEYLKEYWE